MTHACLACGSKPCARFLSKSTRGSSCHVVGQFGKALQMSHGPNHPLVAHQGQEIYCSVQGKRNPFFELDISRASFLAKWNLKFTYLCKSSWPDWPDWPDTLGKLHVPRLVCSRCTGSKGLVPQTGRPIEIAMAHISISGGKYKLWPGMSICISQDLWAYLFLCIYVCYIYIVIYIYIHYDDLWCGCT